MFVYTMKSSAVRRILLLTLVLLAVAAFWYYVHAGRSTALDSAVSLKAGDAAERMAFISQFGWDVDEDPVAVEEIRIPAEFDAVYEQYNAIQMSQDLDLRLYAGERVKQWTYAVRNYPGYENRDDAVQIRLLIRDGCVIGGDVRSVLKDGFLHGFDRPEPSSAAAS